MSISNAQVRAPKKRVYRLGKRADRQQATRRRIVEAAIDLHSAVGPARTTVSQIAERAGVQRHTYYAHFPEERDLFLACSGLALERDPLPDAGQLLSAPPGRERLCLGLGRFYGWFERNREQSACVLRDAEYHPLTREMVELRMAPVFRQAEDVLAEGLDEQACALLRVALNFHCWERLSASLPAEAAADLMSEAIAAIGQPARA